MAFSFITSNCLKLKYLKAVPYFLDFLNGEDFKSAAALVDSKITSFDWLSSEPSIALASTR